jgi:hypothetical protein
MVTLAGLEPATFPAPGEQGRSPPLSYSVVTTFLAVCGGARADTCGGLTKARPRARGCPPDALNRASSLGVRYAFACEAIASNERGMTARVMIRIFSANAWRRFGSRLLTATYNTAQTEITIVLVWFIITLATLVLLFADQSFSKATIELMGRLAP